MWRHLLVLTTASACIESADTECQLDLHGNCVVDAGDDGAGGKADDDAIHQNWGSGLVVVGERADVDDVVDDLNALTQSTMGKGVLDLVGPRAAELGSRVMVRARPSAGADAMTCANTMFAYGAADLRKAQIVKYLLGEDGAVQILERGGAVDPSSIRVMYNRECAATYDDGSPCAPARVYLLHELQHALHAMTGEIANHIRDTTDPMPGGSNHEEAWTIGRGAYTGRDLTENALRLELGVPVRDSHGSLCGPR